MSSYSGHLDAGPEQQARGRPEGNRLSRLLPWRARPVFGDPDADAGIGERLTWRRIGWEWAIIVVAVLIFCAGFLDLGSGRLLPGNEAEIFQSLDWVLVRSLREHTGFPLWNPYLHTGLPYVADPMLHAYNPVVVLPVLALGVLDGFKVALFLSFLLAALGMWWLGRVCGAGGPIRVWMGLMYAFTGQAVARFFQGQYLFTFGYAWIPLILAALILAARSRRRLHVALASLFLAMLVFSGNFYYPFFMVFVFVLFALVAVIEGRSECGLPRVNRQRMWVLATVILLAVGLVAVQVFPLAEFWPHINKPVAQDLSGSHTLRQILLDYTSRDPSRPDAIQSLPPQDFYAYTGIWPFLALLCLPLAVWKRDRQESALDSQNRVKVVLFFALLLAWAVAWVDVRDMPWRSWYIGDTILGQFRYPTRMLVFGAVALVVLAGLGLDALWRLLRPAARLRRLSVPDVVRSTASYAGVCLLAIFLFVSVVDVARTNRVHARTLDPYPDSYNIMSWLRKSDPDVFYVSNPNGWHGAIVSNGLRYIDAWYHFADIRDVKGAVNQRVVQARPNYEVLGTDRAPEGLDAEAIQRFSDHIIYRLPHSLPYAFTVTDAQLADPSEGRELAREDVIPLEPVVESPNRVAVTTRGDAGSSIVILTTAYPGWRVRVDGRPALLKNVGGYLSTDVQPGDHTYLFEYAPISFKVGLLITIVSLFGVFGLLWGEARAKAARKRPARFRLEGVFEGGVLKPAQPIDLPDGTRVGLVIEPQIEREGGGSYFWRGLSLWLATERAIALEWALFAVGLMIYGFTRLWALDRFPIFFFADEATHAVLASELLSRGLRDGRGSFLPLYFEAAGNRWTPLLSVYVHILPVALFGKSIFTTRAVSAVVTLGGAAAAALILKLVFKARYWWTGVLFMMVAPAWFLHSRTGFETVMMASFYAAFLLFYLLYRTRSPNYLFGAIAFGAATFYTYSNGQMIMAATAVLLAVSDLRYHLRQWRTVLVGLLFVAVLAVPLLHFRAQQPGSFSQHLRAIDSYWFRDTPLVQKIQQFVKTYAYGLSPQYWFFPNEHDLMRHRMKGYGNLSIAVLPFILIGIVLCFRRIRSAPQRTVLLAALAAPAGAALVDVTITRVMAFVVPASILAGLGLDSMLQFLTQRLHRSTYDGEAPGSRKGWVYTIVALVVFGVFSLAGLGILRDALVNGPLWYRDYGLYGMQWGAKQLFADAIPEVLAKEPNTLVLVTSTWANGADTFIRFFLPKDLQGRVQMLNIDYFMSARRDLTPDMLLVMTPSEYEQALASHKFDRIDVERLIPYPDGSPGFYFARLAYAGNLDDVLAQEKAARSKPVTEEVVIDGQTVQVSHSQFDSGRMSDIFDGDTFTLARGMEANPLVFEFTFPEERTVSGLRATFGSGDYTLTVKVFPADDSEARVYTQTYEGLPPDPNLELLFDEGAQSVKKLRLEIQQHNTGDPAHIHVRELQFIP